MNSPSKSLQLLNGYTVSLLQQDLDALYGHIERTCERGLNQFLFDHVDYDDHGVIIVPLKNPGGDVHNNYSDRAGLKDWEYTSFIEHTPYLKRIIEDLPGRVNCARLFTLIPGGDFARHVDPGVGIAYGFMRFHIPITTNPQSILCFEGEEITWQPGGLYFADFLEPHWGYNKGNANRTHLLVDIELSPALLELFPEHALKAMNSSRPYFPPRPVVLSEEELASYNCTVALRGTFVDDGFGFTAPIDSYGYVRSIAGKLFFFVDNEPKYQFVPVGADCFRIAGSNPNVQVVITRSGRDAAGSIEFRSLTKRHAYPAQFRLAR